jgi:uncharacterized protein (TIGR00290 family)
MTPTKAIFNWSGGKDSALALYKILQQNEYEIISLLTSISEEHQRISMHGVRTELLDQQAESVGLPLHKMILPESADLEAYNQKMSATLAEFKKQKVEASLFGDIFLEDLRAYREEQLSKANMKGVFPLWKIPSEKLIREFITLGFKTMVVCVNEKYLDSSFAGRIIDDQFLKDIPANVDPCGENGEFHTFVFDGPLFKHPISFSKGAIVQRKYSSLSGSEADTTFCFCDLLPD